jgi:hypothetical protein
LQRPVTGVVPKALSTGGRVIAEVHGLVERMNDAACAMRLFAEYFERRPDAHEGI